MRLVTPILLAMFLTACATVNLVDTRATAVKVSSGFGHGSGTLISPTEILTARHVVRAGETLEIEFYDGTKVPAKVTWMGEDNDAAILTLESPISHYSAIDCRPLKLGERVHTFGNPEFLRFVLTEGVIADDQSLGTYLAMMPPGMPVDVQQMILVSANWEPGDSGAAIFDEAGRVRGTVSIVFNTDRGGISNNALITPVTVLPACTGRTA